MPAGTEMVSMFRDGKNVQVTKAYFATMYGEGTDAHLYASETNERETQTTKAVTEITATVETRAVDENRLKQ